MNTETDKRVAPSAERNKSPILNELRQQLQAGDRVLEIGSGTGQHACYFAAQLPQLIWQPTELPGQLADIHRWMADEGSENILPPQELDVTRSEWPFSGFNIVYTCNTLHIMPAQAVERLFERVAGALAENGCLCAYGPFSFDGEQTATSNAQFDHMLRAENPQQGIRDMTWLNKLAVTGGLQVADCRAMPSNNFFAIWRKAQ